MTYHATAASPRTLMALCVRKKNAATVGGVFVILMPQEYRTTDPVGRKAYFSGPVHGQLFLRKPGTFVPEPVSYTL
jgi:hypothetical protein